MASRSWSDLPVELLEEIVFKLGPEDSCYLLQFRDVCPSWRCVVDNLIQTNKQFQLRFFPLQFVSSLEFMGRSNQGFFHCNSFRCKEHKLPTAPHTQQPQENKSFDLHHDIEIVYSSHGWLLLASRVTSEHGSGQQVQGSNISSGSMITLAASLYNPLPRVQLKLPPLPHSCSLDEAKFTISSDPFTVLALVENKKLFFWRRGDKQWYHIDVKNDSLADIIRYKGEFYAIDLNFNMIHIELCATNGRASNVIEWDGEDYLVFACNLVESFCGDLWMVFLPICNSKFQVFRMDWSKREWICVRSLNGGMLFPGSKSEALSFPFFGNESESQPNQIYYSITSDFHPVTKGQPNIYGIYNYRWSRRLPDSLCGLQKSQLWYKL